jgi:hypothetical protein
MEIFILILMDICWWNEHNEIATSIMHSYRDDEHTFGEVGR